MKEHPIYPSIGDRIVVITNENKHVEFGKRGYVTGVYEDTVEIVFDEKCIGLTNLSGRCENFRGHIMNLLEIFNLTCWSKDVIQKNPKTTNDLTWNYNIDKKNM